MDPSAEMNINFPGFIPFNTTDLAANREGQLTARQIKSIQEMYQLNKKRFKVIHWTSIIFWLIVCILHAVFTLSGVFDAQDVIFALAVFIILIPLWFIPSHFSRDMNEKFVKQRTTLSAVGKARKVKVLISGRTTIEPVYITINKVWFHTTQVFSDLIEEQQNYAFYYIPSLGENRIVSWEKVQNTNL